MALRRGSLRLDVPTTVGHLGQRQTSCVSNGEGALAYIIRPARPDDAAGISRVVLSALRETNARDYGPEVIARVERSFSPEGVTRLLGRRQAFVAEVEGAVIGTASLDGAVVRTVFVDPRWQGHGVGRKLMAQIELLALEDGVATLKVPSSVTAEGFYRALGYTVVRAVHDVDERTIVMELPLRLSEVKADGN